MEEGEFIHVERKKVKEDAKEAVESDSESWHCDCAYCDYTPLYDEKEVEPIRKNPTKSCKKSCGTSKPKQKKSKGEKALTAVKRSLPYEIKNDTLN